MENNYYSMTPTGDRAEILIYDQIGASMFSEGVGAKQFAIDLKALGDVKQLDVRINSPGGSVFEGLAIYNTLRANPAHKTVYVDGIAASIASVIAMAGDKIVMPENALMMVHKPWTTMSGDANELRKQADILDKLETAITSAYMTKFKFDVKNLSDLLSGETWMNASEAFANGFATDVTDTVKVAANFDLSMFKNVPKEIINETEETMTSKTIVETIKTIIKGEDKMDDKTLAEFTAKVDLFEARAVSAENELAMLRADIAAKEEIAFNVACSAFVDMLEAEMKSAPADREKVLNRMKKFKADAEVLAEYKDELLSRNVQVKTEVIATGESAPLTGDGFKAMVEAEKELDPTADVKTIYSRVAKKYPHLV